MLAEDAGKGDVPPSAVADLMPGKPLYSIYFGYVKSWWPFRHDPNVLMLHYTNVRKDLKGSVSDIAKFLDVDLTEAELDTVTQRCTLEHMKKPLVNHRFNYQLALNKDKGLWDVQKNRIMKEGTMTLTGGVKTGERVNGLPRITEASRPQHFVNASQFSKGHAIFSDKVVAQWRKAEEDEFGSDPAMLHWAREGGELPPISDDV